ncbi:hypothetical protein LPY66_12615 [Dehalobacter sp. DCM]|uniref:hypothetical protein n=1 Tax=Dehalobacter sp. DCM TaxID=2907827 RepID=UPI0030815BDF|nr:hypothetical protein LPY66_12615 [Dehalobacter sp. DCM]
MENMIQDFCIECGVTSDFFYDGEQWVCKNCGSHNSQGIMIDSIPSNNDEEP